MKIKFILIILGLIIFFLPLKIFAALPWPADATGQEVGNLLPNLYEPSGLTWQTRLEKILTVDDGGKITKMDQDGNNAVTWTAGGDNEGITIADPNTNYAYIGVENPDSIREFDLSSGSLTGKSWDLTTWMTSSDSNRGLEALTFVPNGYHPYNNSNSGGVFYAGLQNDGKIYVFDVNLNVSGEVSFLGTITPKPGITDISGMYFNDETELIYVLFDNANLLIEMRPNGEVVNEYSLPGTGHQEEGITLLPSYPNSTTSIYIAQDDNKSILKYNNYPVTYPLTKDKVAPEVSVSTDKDEYTNVDKINITALASDDYLFDRVAILIDGEEKTSCTSSPCIYEAGPYTEKGGQSITVSARAFDKAGNSSESTKSIKINSAIIIKIIKIDSTISIKTNKNKIIAGKKIQLKTKVNSSSDQIKRQGIFINGKLVKTCKNLKPCSYKIKKYNPNIPIFYKAVLYLKDGKKVSTSYKPVIILRNSHKPLIWITADKWSYNNGKVIFSAEAEKKMALISIFINNKIVKQCHNTKSCVYKKNFLKTHKKRVFFKAAARSQHKKINYTNNFILMKK